MAAPTAAASIVGGTASSFAPVSQCHSSKKEQDIFVGSDASENANAKKTEVKTKYSFLNTHSLNSLYLYAFECRTVLLHMRGLGFADLLLKSELMRAITDRGYERPAEGLYMHHHHNNHQVCSCGWW
jgi:hypothetical protein